VPPAGAGKPDCGAWKGAAVRSGCAPSVQGCGTKSQRCPAVWLGPQAAD